MSAAEEWLPILGFEGYEVSSLGRVLSHRQGRTTELKQQLYKNGYWHVCIYRDKKKHCRTVHSIVALAFIGPRPTGIEVRHLDGDPLNNRADNLAHGTHSDNQFDQVRHGTHPNASKTHCKWGHLFDELNTGEQTQTGGRYCIACKRETNRRNYIRRTLAAANVREVAA